MPSTKAYFPANKNKIGYWIDCFALATELTYVLNKRWDLNTKRSKLYKDLTLKLAWLTPAKLEKAQVAMAEKLSQPPDPHLGFLGLSKPPASH